MSLDKKLYQDPGQHHFAKTPLPDPCALLVSFRPLPTLRSKARTLIGSLRAERIGISIFSSSEVGPVDAVAAELGACVLNIAGSS